jgi:hypothetical protein
MLLRQNEDAIIVRQRRTSSFLVQDGQTPKHAEVDLPRSLPNDVPIHGLLLSMGTLDCRCESESANLWWAREERYGKGGRAE